MRTVGCTYNKNRLIVTGANGFVGRAVCAEASARGKEVIGVARYYSKTPIGVKSTVIGDINHNTDWQKLFVDSDVVIHLAARAHVMQENLEDPLAEFRQVNTVGQNI